MARLKMLPRQLSIRRVGPSKRSIPQFRATIIVLQQILQDFPASFLQTFTHVCLFLGSSSLAQGILKIGNVPIFLRGQATRYAANLQQICGI
jgi:hypothetical protein